MSHVEDRTIHVPPVLPDRDRGTGAEPPDSGGEATYVSPTLKPTRAVAVTVRRIGKIAPRAYRDGEAG